MASLRKDTHPASPGHRERHPDASVVEEHQLTVARTVRYYAVGGTGAGVRELWYVLHGYGQLGRYFIRHFRDAAGPHRRVVAPEALSRFYLNDTYQRIGASWMTREDRLHEIDDYLAYLQAVHGRLAEEVDLRTVRIHLLGFSQGAEAAARWATLGGLPVQRLVLWGGRLPTDLDAEAHGPTLRSARLTLVAGTEDHFATPARLGEMKALLEQHDIPYEAISYDGGHHLDADVVASLMDAKA